MNRSRFAFVVGTAVGDCAAMWPPVPAGTGTPQLDGVDASAVGTVSRTDGSKQLTLRGMPLYQFANDTKAGDVKGQAVGRALVGRRHGRQEDHHPGLGLRQQRLLRADQ